MERDTKIIKDDRSNIAEGGSVPRLTPDFTLGPAIIHGVHSRE